MAPNVCTHTQIPAPLRPMPRVIHNEGDGLCCPICAAFIVPAPSDSLGRSVLPRMATA